MANGRTPFEARIGTGTGIGTLRGAQAGGLAGVLAADLAPPAVEIGVAATGLNELHACAADAVSVVGLSLALACRVGGARPILLVARGAGPHEAGHPSASGMAELGLDPGQLIEARPRDAIGALQAALEGARCAGLGAVIVELWGDVRAYDLTASRRLALAAKATGVPVLAARIGARPVASAAETRWLVRAAPSRALAAQAPGRPAFEMTLLRARSGQEGLFQCVEWDRDARQFVCRVAADAGAGPVQRRESPLSGAVVALSFDRPGARPGGQPGGGAAWPRRQAG